MIRTISPVDGRVYVERAAASAAEIDAPCSARAPHSCIGAKYPLPTAPR